MTDARLEIAAGFATLQGPKADNQDFGGVHLGSPIERREHGVVAVVADGVSGSKAGRTAAELATRSFIDGYLDQNPLNGIAANGIKALRGFNRWLHAKGRSDPAMTAAATTFTALVLRGREATALHVGDSRAWNFRDGVLTRLTAAGAAYLVIVCLLPEVMRTQLQTSFYFGGTSLLIVVVVVMDFIAQIQAHLMSHQYESLLKKANLKGGSRGGGLARG